MTLQRETLECTHLPNCIQVALLTFANPPVNLKDTEKEREENEQQELNIKHKQYIFAYPEGN